MLKKIWFKFKLLKKISFFKFLHYNFFCKHVSRERGVYIIPYKGAKIQLDKNSKIYLKGKNLEIGINKIRGSKAETYVRLKKDAVWKCNNGCNLCYNSDIEVHENAVLESGFFYANTLTTIVCTKHISLGEGVWLGRNIIIYDSDYHQIQDNNGNMINHSKPVVIGNHVWLTNQIMVMKGVHIEDGVVVTPFSVIRKDVSANSMVGNKTNTTTFKQDVYWSSDRVTDYGFDKEGN